MRYPILILGAGASHDYSKGGQKPPLTKDLVQAEYFDGGLLAKYPEVSNLLSSIEISVNRDNQSFETALNEIRNRSQSNPDRKIQIVALRFYLQELFEKISKEFQKINHYKVVQDLISDYFSQQACIVSFNYDTLFEESVINNPFKKMSSYINGPLKLIKPHGSHDWRYVRRKDGFGFEEYEDAYSFLKQNPDYFEELGRKDDKTPYHHEEASKRNEFLRLPAIAIPLPNKQNWICPKEHIECLKRSLSIADRILVIGWRAADYTLLDIMKECVDKNVSVLVVSKKEESAKEISHIISKRTGLRCEINHGGFSSFVNNERCRSFFSST